MDESQYHVFNECPTLHPETSRSTTTSDDRNEAPIRVTNNRGITDTTLTNSRAESDHIIIQNNNVDLQIHDVNIMPDHENEKDDLSGTPNDIPNPPDNINTDYDSEKNTNQPQQEREPLSHQNTTDIFSDDPETLKNIAKKKKFYLRRSDEVRKVGAETADSGVTRRPGNVR